jgi:ferritin
MIPYLSYEQCRELVRQSAGYARCLQKSPEGTPFLPSLEKADAKRVNFVGNYLRRQRRRGMTMTTLISPELNRAFNEQIGRELFASHQYIAIACYFDGRALKKLAAMFFKQSDEEREHAMKFVEYLNEVAARWKFPPSKRPPASSERGRGGASCAKVGAGGYPPNQRPDDDGD